MTCRTFSWHPRIACLWCGHPAPSLELGPGNQKTSNQLATDFHFIGYIYKNNLHVLFLKCQHLKCARKHSIYICLHLNVICQFKYLKEVEVFKIHLEMHGQRSLKNTVREHKSSHVEVVSMRKGRESLLCQSLQSSSSTFRMKFMQEHDMNNMTSLASAASLPE